MKRLVKFIIKFLLALYLICGFILYYYQRNLLYFPSKFDFDACEAFGDSQKLNLNGTRSYFKKKSDDVIIFYHGNAGSACDRAHLKALFESSNHSYLFVEYTGFLSNLQQPSQKALMNDVRNVNEFLTSQKFHQIIIVGESLGTSLAAYHSSLIHEDKLLLISPFYELSEVAQDKYKIYPIQWMLKDNYNSGQWINDINEAMIIHGSDDDVVPIKYGKKLFDCIQSDKKVFVEIPGAHHNDIYSYRDTRKKMSEFISLPQSNQSQHKN